MPKLKVLVLPQGARKPENERNNVVAATTEGWVRTPLNHDDPEMLSESRGLVALLADCNLQPDGVTKIDPSKPIGKEVIIDIYDPSSIPVTGIDVLPGTGTVAVGANITFDYDVAPTNASYPEVEWSSSDETVLKTVGEGVFTALKAGNATVSATSIDGGIVGTAAVTVTAANVAVTGVTVSPTTKSLVVGATQQLTPTVAPTNATNKAVTYTSSDATVATVNASGLVTAVKAGTTNITVNTTDGNKTAVCAVTVTAA